MRGYAICLGTKRSRFEHATQLVVSKFGKRGSEDRIRADFASWATECEERTQQGIAAGLPPDEAPAAVEVCRLANAISLWFQIVDVFLDGMSEKSP
ncbi:MAG: hypothetical protein AAF479_10150 [Pseudomonadota bacterium]